jgi:hypothetical protein
MEYVTPKFKVGDRVRLTYPIQQNIPGTTIPYQFYPTGAEGVIEEVEVKNGKNYQVVWYSVRMGDNNVKTIAEMASQIELV